MAEWADVDDERVCCTEDRNQSELGFKCSRHWSVARHRGPLGVSSFDQASSYRTTGQSWVTIIVRPAAGSTSSFCSGYSRPETQMTSIARVCLRVAKPC